MKASVPRCVCNIIPILLSLHRHDDSLLVLNRWPIMQEVSDYVDSTRNKRIRGLHSQADEFDGLSPDEINQLGQ